MLYAKHKLTLDVHSANTQKRLNVKKGDTIRQLCISLTENGKPYIIQEDCTAVFRAKKPDGNVIYNSCTIEDNVIYHVLTTQTLEAVGLVRCEIQLLGSSGNQITSPVFEILSIDNLYDDSEVESQSEYSELTELIQEVEYKLEHDEFKGDKGDTGDKGDDGEDGEDGFSPTVSITEITGGHRVTITDATGSHTFDVLDGEVESIDEYTANEIETLWNEVSV